MSAPPTFSDLLYFHEAAETGNFSRAAERLGIAQPSLSTAIKRLEASFGATLFVRSRSGVQLTKSGRELQIHGRALLQNWESLKSSIIRSQSAICGQYIIGCHPTVALYALPDFLPRLIRDNPELEVKLVHDLSRKINEAVISHEVDFGIVVNPVRHPDLVIRELYHDEVMLWTARKPSTTQDLSKGSPVIICDQNLIQVQKILSDVSKGAVSQYRLIQCGNLEVVAELAACGVGIGVLPRRAATRVPSKKLVPLDENKFLFKDRVCLVYRADSQKTAAGKLIAKAIIGS